MVPILSVYIYRNTHTKTGGGKKETRKAAEREAQGRKTEEKEREGGCFLPAQDLHHLPGRTTWEQSRGPRHGGRRRRSPAQLRGATPRPRLPSPPQLSIPPQLSRAPPLTSGPCRQGQRQQAQPGGAHAPGHGGSGHSCAPRSLAHSHASLPTRRQRVWNPLLAQRLPAQQLPAIGGDAPPSAPQGSATGWRRGRARKEGREGPPGEESAGPLGSHAGPGDLDQLRGRDSLTVDAA